MKKSILFPFSFFLLVLFSQPLFSQVKYTSGGYFGIGTTSPQKLLHLKDTHPYLWMEGGGNGESLIRFTEGANMWYGAYLGYNGASNKFSIGMHNSSSSSTAYDKDIITIERNFGNISFWPQYPGSSFTFTTYSLSNNTLNYVVQNRTSTNPDHFLGTFSVTGDGTVTCKQLYEFSDISLKENIEDISSSIDIVNKLRPVKYNMIYSRDSVTGESEIDYGLIAQELETVFPEAVREGSDGYKSISYRKILILLLDVVQQQQVEIEEIKSQSISNEESALKSLPTGIAIEESSALLEQNQPNPFDERTVIRYFIPEINSKAMLNVYDLQGKQLSSYSISISGGGELSIDAYMFKAGMYLYTLIVDGEIIDTKQMVIVE